MPGLIVTLAENAPAPAPGLLITWYTAMPATTRPAKAIIRPATPRSTRTPELTPPATITRRRTRAAATARPMSPPLIAVHPLAVISSGMIAARLLNMPANAPGEALGAGRGTGPTGPAGGTGPADVAERVAERSPEA